MTGYYNVELIRISCLRSFWSRKESNAVFMATSRYSGRKLLAATFSGSNLSRVMKAFIVGIAKERVAVEWLFKEMKHYWPLMDYKRKFRLRKAPDAMMYSSAALLINIQNCVYPKPTRQ